MGNLEYNARIVERNMDEHKKTSEIRTRIAPSPTGDDIHIGNLYTALINYTVAAQHHGAFIIRIEDTDRTRYRVGSEVKILSSLKDFGLKYSEGPDIGGPFAPYRQSERLPVYKKYAEKLVEKGSAYYCFCTRDRLEKLREDQVKKKMTPRYDKHCLLEVTDTKTRQADGEPYVIRLNVEPDKEIIFHDVIRGQITINSNEVDDQVLLKSDGYPTYHLGVVVDDHLMQISHIIRAEEWISSTPKHVLLYQSFGWELPVFAHVPILRNPDKSKLSKRKNPVWASWYLEEGFIAGAVLNYLALLGWSHPEEKEIFSIDEFMKQFKLEDINPVGPVFDITKLRWMNQQYIQNFSDEDLIRRIHSFYSDQKFNEVLLSKLMPLVKTRMETLKDFLPLTRHFFEELHLTPRNDKEREIAASLLKQMVSIQDWQKEAILPALKTVLGEYSIRMPVLYYIFTGQEKGLPLPESLEIVGKEKVVEHLGHFMK
jgi:glutamyl-tRNA synthetase